jgi:allantoate deiminase
LSNCLAQAVEQVAGRAMNLHSGAGHDAAAMAAITPIAMLFVRCRGGISHHPDESVSEEDVTMAIQAVSQFVASLK